MPNRNSLIIVLIAVSLSGCYTRAYYVSPMYGKSSPYYTLPMQKDSLSSSSYVNGSLGIASTNYNLRDDVLDLQTTFYRVHTSKAFKLYYGVSGGIGNYKVRKIENSDIPYYLDTATINRLSGNYFFGSFGLIAGVVFTLPVDDSDFEWRILGVETALLQEFGNYASFRKKLNKDSLSGLVTNNTLGTLTISTEFAGKVKSGEWGIKISPTYLLGKDYKDSELKEDEEGSRYKYFTFSAHLTQRKYTVFMQYSFGERLANFQMGVNYQLSKK